MNRWKHRNNFGSRELALVFDVFLWRSHDMEIFIMTHIHTTADKIYNPIAWTRAIYCQWRNDYNQSVFPYRSFLLAHQFKRTILRERISGAYLFRILLTISCLNYKSTRIYFWHGNETKTEGVQFDYIINVSCYQRNFVFLTDLYQWPQSYLPNIIICAVFKQRF